MSSRQQNWLLSGGIGSGKSTVRGLFEKFGVGTIDADAIGHEVLSPGGAAVNEVAEAWPGVLNDGVIDRQLLGAIVFADPKQLERLERITHPHILELMASRITDSPGLVIVEFPLLTQPFDEKWPRMVVDALEKTRLRRAVSRGQEEADVRRRIAAQPSRSEWLAAADLVIPNSGSLSKVEEVVEQLSYHLFGIQRS
jgi:dephospho-CoA kinase